MTARQGKVPNWYLDVSLLNQYWGSDRVYHHTAPVNMNFGMREALRLLAEEGLDQAWARHRSNAEMLWNGLESLGLSMHVPAERRLPTLTTVRTLKVWMARPSVSTCLITTALKLVVDSAAWQAKSGASA